MKTRKRSTLDGRIAHEVVALSETEKLKLLLGLLSGSVGRWAIQRGHHPEEVYMTISNKRPYPEIREKLAESAGMTREEMDRLIEGEATARAAA